MSQGVKAMMGKPAETADQSQRELTDFELTASILQTRPMSKLGHSECRGHWIA